MWFAEVDEGDDVYQLIALVDRNHRHIRLCYGERDEIGRETRYTYDTFGDLESVTDALGHTTRHHYDEAGNHIRTDYPDGSAEHFEYDRLNRLTAHIDGLGAKTAYELAVDGLPLKRINALGHTFAYAYDKARSIKIKTVWLKKCRQPNLFQHRYAKFIDMLNFRMLLNLNLLNLNKDVCDNKIRQNSI